MDRPAGRSSQGDPEVLGEHMAGKMGGQLEVWDKTGKEGVLQEAWDRAGRRPEEDWDLCKYKFYPPLLFHLQ